MPWRNRVEVSYGALRANALTVIAAANGRQVIAVVKADAYGLGLERCARIYHQAGVAALAVAAISEADRVRKVAPEARVLLLGSPLPEERRAAVTSGFEVSCSTAEEIEELAHLASERTPHPVHISVDTGMGRFGAEPEEAEQLVRLALSFPSLRLAGVGTHYAMAWDAAVSAGQELLFAGLLARLPPLPDGCWIHYANSEGLLLRPPGPSTAVRVGLLLTGVVPTACQDPGLVPAVTWISAISLVKRLPKGHGISYNRQRQLDRDSVVGVVPVGYADGYPLSLSDRGFVLVQGSRCPVLGRVTMDYIMVDLTDLARTPTPGEGVVLFGGQGDARISVMELAKLAGTIPYDILCGLRGRCEFVGVP